MMKNQKENAQGDEKPCWGLGEGESPLRGDGGPDGRTDGASRE